MYKAVTMASMKEIFTHLPDDIAIRLHAPASLAITSVFCFGKPTAGSRKDLEKKWDAVGVPSWLHTRPPRGAGREMNTHRKDIALAATARPLDQLKIWEEVLQWEKEGPEDSSDEENKETQEKEETDPSKKQRTALNKKTCVSAIFWWDFHMSLDVPCCCFLGLNLGFGRVKLILGLLALMSNKIA